MSSSASISLRDRWPPRWAAEHFAPEAEIVLVHVLRGPEAPPFLQPLVEPMLDRQ